jgi:hypothetical protein
MVPLMLTVLGDAERGERFYREHFEPALDRMVERITENLDQWSHHGEHAQVHASDVYGFAAGAAVTIACAAAGATGHAGLCAATQLIPADRLARDLGVEIALG